MNPLVRDFEIALVRYYSMTCLTRDSYGQVSIEFDGLVEAQAFEEALQRILKYPLPLKGERLGNLLDDCLSLRLDQYRFERNSLVDLQGWEEGTALRWRFVWEMPLASMANELYIRFQWMLDKQALIV